MNARVGFTGTQRGMTPRQKEAVLGVLVAHDVVEVHHGDCIGADQQMHALARTLNLRIVLHPPEDEVKRAFCSADVVRAALPYLARNERIVDETEMLIATPKSYREEVRSGTWATVRRARKAQKEVVVVWPNGDVEYEGQR